MCPTNILLQLLVVMVLFILVLQYKQKKKVARKNFEILSKLLQSPQIKQQIFKLGVEGFYKGRRVALKYCLLLGEAAGGCCPVDFYIETQGYLKKPKLICISYPRPTKNTQLRGNKLYYLDYDVCGRIYRTEYDEQGFVNILEELTQVAQSVEKENICK